MLHVMICPKCGIQGSLSQRQCSSCGSPLVAACPSCKRPIVPRASICNSCGTKMLQAAREQPASVNKIAHDFSQESAILTCRACGQTKPTRHVSFYQNIGLLIMRMHKSIDGQLCKSCINHYFWEFTLITLFLGWWGLISFFFTLFILPNNIIYYLTTLTLRDRY
jgi:hypothetical protein